MTIGDALLSGIAFLVILFITVKILKLELGFKYERFLLILVLFIPLSLLAGFVHEFGHALLGIALGGRLTYMQVAYFEIYPRLALASHFQLGLVRVEGLTSDFAHGLFLLGGSMSTNIASWLLAVILLKMKFRSKVQLGLRILGILGLLDLPFYVVLPQIGLQHWIFLGGEAPEPLIGARMVGISDLSFYVIVFFTTFGLSLIYFKSFWVKAWKGVRKIL